MTAANRRRGVETERAVAKWWRENGFPGADRTVRTGYRTATRAADDMGDLGLCPGVVVQVKSLRPANAAERAVPRWLDETESQRRAAGADVALLVVRRDGTADVGEWWCWLRYPALVQVGTGGAAALLGAESRAGIPVRLAVADVCFLLRAAGYGDPIEHGTKETK